MLRQCTLLLLEMEETKYNCWSDYQIWYAGKNITGIKCKRRWAVDAAQRHRFRLRILKKRPKRKLQLEQQVAFARAFTTETLRRLGMTTSTGQLLGDSCMSLTDARTVNGTSAHGALFAAPQPIVCTAAMEVVAARKTADHIATSVVAETDRATILSNETV